MEYVTAGLIGLIVIIGVFFLIAAVLVILQRALPWMF